MESRSLRLAGLVVVAILGGCVSEPVESPSPTPTPTPSAAASLRPVASTIAVADAVWTLAGLGNDRVSLQLSAVVAVSDGFVATGSRGQAGEQPAAFHSPDGATWTEEGISARNGSPDGLLAWGDRVLAIGDGETGRECAHPFAIDTWVRTADATWTEAPFDRVFCDNGGRLVVQGDRAWLAGSVRDIPSLLETSDGLTWTRRTDRLGGLYPRDAAVDAAGLWVFASDLAGGSVALVSRDGTRFERRPIVTAAGQPADVLAAAVLGGEVVVIVTAGDAVGVLRPLADGGWSEVQAAGLPARNIASIETLDGHLLALGSDDDGLPLAFASGDGTKWVPIPLPAEAGAGTTLNGVAVRNGVAVLVGQVPALDGSGAVGAVWTGPAALLEP